MRTKYYNNKFGLKDSISNYWYPDGTKGEEIIYKDIQEKSWTVWDHKGRKFRPYLDLPLDTISRSDDVLEFDKQGDGLYYLKDSDKPYTGLFLTEGLLLNSKDRPTEWQFNLIGFRDGDYKTEVLMIFGKPHGPHKQFESDGDLIAESFIEQDRWDGSYSSSSRYRGLRSQRASRPLTVNTNVVIFFLLLIGGVVILFLKKKKVSS
jgi:antitoxin component YwqK of YwqJK toxin-antitoxin module